MFLLGLRKFSRNILANEGLGAVVNTSSYYDEYLNIFVDTCCACAVFVMAHPLISCIVYGTQNDNYHNQLGGGVRGKNGGCFS